tara:strand:- start:203 stop:331 length:129 start_codon:yes stop_codon:yes gene_type:complete
MTQKVSIDIEFIGSQFFYETIRVADFYIALNNSLSYKKTYDG